jgi:Ca2+-binding RTX toxin-like protein
MRSWMLLETGPARIDATDAETVAVRTEARFLATGGADDVVRAEADVAIGFTGAGADTVLNEAVVGTLFTGAGDDIAVNNWIMDRLWLGEGDDRLINTGQIGRVDAGAGDDLLYFAPTASGALEIRGGTGADTFFFDAAPATFTIADFGAADRIDLSAIEGTVEPVFRETEAGGRYDILIDGEATGLAVELDGRFEPLAEDAFVV